ncbi:MAG: DNA-processing protein DprA [Alphaproteobacteria bacterium]|nr:DNA-processing protein DprA [Alphaproteobacteria bacterium]
MTMQRRSLNHNEKRDWLRLTRTENVGPILFRQLLRRFNTIQDALNALPELAKRGGGKRTLSPPSISKIEDEMAALEKLDGRMIALCEPDYPEALASIEDAPPVISVIGQVSLLHKRSIGIVGARNASLNGRKMAEKLADELGKNNFVITSGLARGIDTSAHRASLSTGTVAVIAGGVDIVYPEENRGLYEQICENGAVVSEQHFGCEPRAQLFPKRNRLISGLSLGVIVVEAAKQSGSLITARMALEQGREVFAVPGSPLDPRANGTNDLLRQGAVVTEGAADVLAHIHSMPKNLMERPSSDIDYPSEPINEQQVDAARAKILENLGFSPVAVDELIRECQLSPPLVLTVLMELELAGRIERQPGHNVALIE